MVPLISLLKAYDFVYAGCLLNLSLEELLIDSSGAMDQIMVGKLCCLCNTVIFYFPFSRFWNNGKMDYNYIMLTLASKIWWPCVGMKKIHRPTTLYCDFHGFVEPNKYAHVSLCPMSINYMQGSLWFIWVNPHLFFLIIKENCIKRGTKVMPSECIKKSYYKKVLYRYGSLLF